MTRNARAHFEVALKLSLLFGFLIYFERQVLRPKTFERIGKMDKRRLDALRAALENTSDNESKILLLQVKARLTDRPCPFEVQAALFTI